MFLERYLGYNFKEKKKIYFIFYLLFFIFSSSELLTDNTQIEDQLLKRKKIIRLNLEKKILSNKNIDFNELSFVEIDLGSTSVKCFFGYQETNRIVLCY